jgi:glucosamine-6-phosphate deaminase
MNIRVLKDPQALGKAAAETGGSLIREVLREQENAHVVIATGTSQFETLTQLVQQEVDWSRVHVFYLDEYIGLDDDHPASFRKYIRERFVEKIPALASVTYINGNAEDLKKEIDRLNQTISRQLVDVAFIGIGENTHIAFNDPPGILTLKIPTSGLNWTRYAGNSNWEKVGTIRWRRCPYMP